MGTSYIEYNPNQLYLLPVNPGEWLEEDIAFTVLASENKPDHTTTDRKLD